MTERYSPPSIYEQLMSRPNLRLYRDDRSAWQAGEELDRVSGISKPRTQSLPLGKLAELLIDAATSDRVWLHDFRDENVQVDADLFEILMTYDRVRRRDAA